MKTMKESQLKSIFESFGLSEGIFDLFKKYKISKIDKEIEDIIDSAPTKKEKEALRDLSKAFRKANSLGVFK